MTEGCPHHHADGSAAASPSLSRGTRFWRSLEELSGTPAFEEMLHREFPSAASVWTDSVSRRRFLSVMGGSIALAGMGGCYEKPEERIVPYVVAPENVVAGKSMFYATAMTLGGYGYGMHVEQTMGRPVKVEGNPRHPSTLGGTNVFMQAAPLGLCDPDRSRAPVYQGNDATWGRFESWLRETVARYGGAEKVRVRLLTETVTSPTLAAQIQRLGSIYKNLVWHQYEPFNGDHALAGAQAAFGRAVNTVYDLSNVRRVLSLDADFLAEGPAHLKLALQFATRRRVRWKPEEVQVHHQSARSDRAATIANAVPSADEMLRLYVAESSYTITGAKADHRLAIRSSEMESLARAIAGELGTGGATTQPAHSDWVRAVARDLAANAGRSLVIAGARQPASVHALAHAMNGMLKNVGASVVYTDPVEANPVDQVQSLRELASAMEKKEVDLLVIVGGNPAFDAPAEFGFVSALENVPNRVRLGLYLDETSFHCDWHLPESHFLEAWGDVRGHDGTASIVQPLIAPLYSTRSGVELMQMMIGGESLSAYDIVRGQWFSTWRKASGGVDVEGMWVGALRAGVVEGTQLQRITVQAKSPSPLPSPGVPGEGVRGVAGVGEGAVEVSFLPDPTIGDGRFANLGWLQECPKPITKITWDNAALLSARTAIELGLAPEDRVEDANGRMVRLSAGGRTVDLPAWVVPGHAEKSISVYCGYGRRRAGRVGNAAGFDVYPLRGADGMARGVKVEALDGRYEIACTQNHQLMQGREIVRVEEIAALIKAEGRAHETPVEQNRRQLESEDRGNGGKAVHLSLYPEYAYRGYRWGMVIDQTACIGCNACVVACVSENNTPVVGKAEVLRSREMHWLRIDTYFTSTSAQGEWKHQAQIPGDAKALFQPMLCQHCEKAPCEVVCPVAATSHNAEGLNEMTYNRCVGTRYCSNNCPYKVRRFNFFRYAGDEPSLAIVRNPEVSVRTRGVMEKCTYCVQRINRARTEGKIAQVNDPGNVVMRTPAGDAEALPAVMQLTACQQACPTEAIVFGDINDADAWVHRIKFGEAFERIHYGVLEELNTQPRTTYLAVVENSNPSLSGEKHSADAGIWLAPSAARTGKMPVSQGEVQA